MVEEVAIRTLVSVSSKACRILEAAGVPLDIPFKPERARARARVTVGLAVWTLARLILGGKGAWVFMTVFAMFGETSNCATYGG